jgi:hypothetical protein
MSIIVQKDEARKIASAYCPIIYQEFSSILDLVTPFIFGSSESAKRSLPCEVENPTIYYGVREDEMWYYIYYLVYHPFDWTSSKFWLTKLLDQHRHDTEGILFRVSKLHENHVDACTVSHFRFLFETNSDRRVCIRRESHAIQPLTHGYPSGNYVIYTPGSYVLSHLRDFDFERLHMELKKVCLPDSQYDSGFIDSASKRIVNKRGDIWNRPEIVFDTAQKLKRF